MFLDSAYFVKEKAFSESFCNDILRHGDQQKLELAKIADGNQVNRKSHVAWLKNPQLIEQITPLINEANQQAGWNFLLKEFEPLQYTIYNIRDHYDWHIDTHAKSYDNGLIRKLSFTICLNDDTTINNNYTGGNFEICIPHPRYHKHKYFKFQKNFKQGTIIVFPSYVWHKIHPVLSGTRKVLVGWVIGKPFV